MIQASNYLSAIINDQGGNAGISLSSILLMVLAYLAITAVVLRTFQYVKERDIKRYK